MIWLNTAVQVLSHASWADTRSAWAEMLTLEVASATRERILSQRVFKVLKWMLKNCVVQQQQQSPELTV